MVKLIKGDIWDLYGSGHDIVVTTNIGWDPRTFRNNMGAGTVMTAACRFPGLSVWYGRECKRMVEEENISVIYTMPERLFLLPVKPLLDINDPERSWAQEGDYGLIERMLGQLVELEPMRRPGHSMPRVALTLPGCGNGGLDPERMLDIIQRTIGQAPNVDRFVLCDRQLP